MVELSIIIINWHSVDYLLTCIQSIQEQTAKIDYEIIVVDNASFDGCSERLAIEYPSVIFLQSHINLGFARANNLAAKHARGAVLLFLNPDTEVQDQAIERLYINFLRLPDAGVLGCKLLNRDKSLQTSCIQPFPNVFNQVLDTEVFRRWFPKASIWGTAALFENQSIPVEVEAVSGACMMIRRCVFDMINGFSIDYFMYAEDIDLCFKARCASLRNYHLGEAVIIHHGGGSSQRTISKFSVVMIIDSINLFFQKTRGRIYSICYRFTLSGAAIIRMALLILLFPVWATLDEISTWDAIFRKWFITLRWGLGLEAWTKQYHVGQLSVCTTEKVEQSKESFVDH